MGPRAKFNTVHLTRKEVQKMNEKILLAQPIGYRRRGIIKLYYRHELDEHASMFGIKNWLTEARERVP